MADHRRIWRLRARGGLVLTGHRQRDGAKMDEQQTKVIKMHVEEEKEKHVMGVGYV